MYSQTKYLRNQTQLGLKGPSKEVHSTEFYPFINQRSSKHSLLIPLCYIYIVFILAILQGNKLKTETKSITYFTFCDNMPSNRRTCDTVIYKTP